MVSPWQRREQGPASQCQTHRVVFSFLLSPSSVEELGALAGGQAGRQAAGRYAATSGHVTVVSSGFPQHLSIQHIVSRSVPSSRTLLSIKPASPASASLPPSLRVLFCSIRKSPSWPPACTSDHLGATQIHGNTRISQDSDCRRVCSQWFYRKLLMMMQAMPLYIKCNKEQLKKNNMTAASSHPNPQHVGMNFLLTSSSCVQLLSVW